MPDPVSGTGQARSGIQRIVFYWIALKLHYVPGFRRNDGVRIFICRSNNH
ncbi:MAG: hypothetical protein KKH20_09995 [Proteobacteria bacterium]|nr:hypothetical protein [Pseudomonadota bacterium]MBU3981440.1 hypothetical protein [Pseudomonadota bacterium]MBU4101685.1 hypothetical protein [Pseudomonadota bacterium]